MSLQTGPLRRWRDLRVTHPSADRDAAVSLAELAGQNSVAMGADSVVDLLARTTPLLALPGGPPVASELSRWKAALAAECSRRATYLGVALANWQHRHNSATPDLAADVDLRPVGVAGTVLLSASQAAQLERSLDLLGIRGLVPVRARTAGHVGSEVVVHAGRHHLVLPADRAAPVRGTFARRRAGGVEEGFRRGRRRVIEVVAAAAVEAQAAYERVRDAIPEPIAAEAEARLTEVEVRLARLRAEDGEARSAVANPQFPRRAALPSDDSSTPGRRGSRQMPRPRVVSPLSAPECALRTN